ncbi:MAG: hypothetical protein WB791_03785, partial [Waddliaceae bacterium]
CRYVQGSFYPHAIKITIFAPKKKNFEVYYPDYLGKFLRLIIAVYDNLAGAIEKLRLKPVLCGKLLLQVILSAWIFSARPQAIFLGLGKDLQEKDRCLKSFLERFSAQPGFKVAMLTHE